MFSFLETRRTGYDKYCKIKLFSVAILQGASDEPEASQSNIYEGAFCENS